MFCLGILWIMLVPFETHSLIMPQAHFWMEKWEHCELFSMDFPLTRNYSLAKDILHAARVANVSGSSLWLERAKPPLAWSWQIACWRKIQIWGLRPLVCPFGGTQIVGTRCELETLASRFSLGFLWRGGKWMGDDGFLRFRFACFSFCKGWQWFELQEAFVNFVLTPVGVEETALVPLNSPELDCNRRGYFPSKIR